MRTEEEVNEKLEEVQKNIEEMEMLKEASINTKQYGIAKDINAKLSVKKRDRWILNWFLESTN